MSDDLKPPAEKVPAKRQEPPRHLKEARQRICGRWQKKDYKPSKAEQARWEKHCKATNRDPKTGTLKVKAPDDKK